MKAIHKKPSVFFPNLDAIRFFCFISVFFYHSFSTKYVEILTDPTYRFIQRLVKNANLGVNFFFVLSGFLITYLLLIEKEEYKRVDIKKFYMRRVLRIWPLFYFCVFFGFVAFPIFKAYLGGGPSTETANPLFYLVFLNNLDTVKHGLPDSSVLTILWSVAIEEQFYLFWPLIIGLLSTKKLPYVFCFIIAASFMYRFVNTGNRIALEFHTLSCMSDLAVGGLGAYLAIYKPSFKSKVESISPFINGGIYLTTFSVFFFREEIFNGNNFLIGIDRFIVSLLFLFIILEQNFNKRSLFKMHVLKRISKLGQYTYGLYCLHMIGILIMAISLAKMGWNKSLWQVILLEGSGSLAVTIILAYISYHFYEKKFLKLKERFAVVKSKSLNSNLEKKSLETSNVNFIHQVVSE